MTPRPGVICIFESSHPTLWPKPSSLPHIGLWTQVPGPTQCSSSVALANWLLHFHASRALKPQPTHESVSWLFAPPRPNSQHLLFPWKSDSGQLKRLFILRVLLFSEGGIEQPCPRHWIQDSPVKSQSQTLRDRQDVHCHQDVHSICHLSLSDTALRGRIRWGGRHGWYSCCSLQLQSLEQNNPLKEGYYCYFKLHLAYFQKVIEWITIFSVIWYVLILWSRQYLLCVT